MSRRSPTIQAARNYGMHPLTHSIRSWIARVREPIRRANDERNAQMLEDGVIIAHALELKRLQDEEAEVHVGDPDGIESREVLSGVYV